MNFSYETSYFPPAPFVELTLGPPQASLTIGPLSAFVDSGADATVVPLRYLRPLQTQADDRKFLRSQWGERRVVDIYYVDVGIGDIRLPLIEVVADDKGDEVIVGRTVLNRLRVVLDGPRTMVEISG